MHTAAKTARCLGAVLASLLVVAAPAAFAANGGEAKSVAGYTAEPFSEFEQQLSSKQVQSVTFVKRLRLMRIKLKDGRTFIAKYPKKQSGVWEQKARHAHVTVVKLSPEQEKALEKELKGASGKHHKHKIRYIIGAVVIVLIVIGAILLLVRRRRVVD
jgi:ATP-dependent Zn protease